MHRTETHQMHITHTQNSNVIMPKMWTFVNISFSIQYSDKIIAKTLPSTLLVN